MKKLSFAILFIVAIAVSACHYGEVDAQQTLERNEQYKTEKQDYSVNRAGEGGKHEADSAAETAQPADTTTVVSH